MRRSRDSPTLLTLSATNCVASGYAVSSHRASFCPGNDSQASDAHRHPQADGHRDVDDASAHPAPRQPGAGRRRDVAGPPASGSAAFRDPRRRRQRRHVGRRIAPVPRRPHPAHSDRRRSGDPHEGRERHHPNRPRPPIPTAAPSPPHQHPPPSHQADPPLPRRHSAELPPLLLIPAVGGTPGSTAAAVRAWTIRGGRPTAAGGATGAETSTWTVASSRRTRTVAPFGTALTTSSRTAVRDSPRAAARAPDRAASVQVSCTDTADRPHSATAVISTRAGRAAATSAVAVPRSLSPRV